MGTELDFDTARKANGIAGSIDLVTTEPEIVADIIRDVGVAVLGRWDGCCCCRFTIRCVNIDVSCGKGSDEQCVRVWSRNMDYDYDTEDKLRPVMDEVVKQVEEQSGRYRPFKRYFREWKK